MRILLATVCLAISTTVYADPQENAQTAIGNAETEGNTVDTILHGIPNLNIDGLAQDIPNATAEIAALNKAIALIGGPYAGYALAEVQAAQQMLVPVANKYGQAVATDAVGDGFLKAAKTDYDAADYGDAKTNADEAYAKYQNAWDDAHDASDDNDGENMAEIWVKLDNAWLYLGF